MKRFAAALGLLWLAGAAPTAGGEPRLEWVPCWFEAPFGHQVRCAHFYPSHAGAAPRPRLPVVHIATDLVARRESRLLYLPAGPGSATGLDERGIARWTGLMQRTRWPHDLVLYDARGAGLSRPRLDCPEIVAADQSGLALPLGAKEDLRRLQAAARACAQRLQGSGLQLADYGPQRQVRDIGELLALLGGRDWNLWGVSYGSRLALHVAREYPQSLRALVLDSAYPPEVNGLLAKPRQFGLALERLPALCAADAACAAAHPALDRELAELRRRLAIQPVQLQVEKWPGLWRRTLALNDYRLLWLLFIESYRPFQPPRYPAAIREALAGRYEAMLPLAEAFIQSLLDPDASHPVYYAATCAEDLPGVTREAYLAQVRRYPAVAPHLTDEWDLHACHHWPAADLPARFRQPVRSSVPALFLSGAHDPATLPAWAAAAARGFQTAHHFVFGGSGHAVTWDDDCAMAVAWEFLREPRAAPHDPCRGPAPQK